MLKTEVVRVPLPTSDGTFEIRAFGRGNNIFAAMVLGDVEDQTDVLVRLHSECLTGDALGSLRCDCGIQLRLALRMINANGTIIGNGTEAVSALGVGRIADGIHLINRSLLTIEEDLILAWDVDGTRSSISCAEAEVAV